MTDRTATLAVAVVGLLSCGPFGLAHLSGQTERSAGKSNTDPALERLTAEFEAAFNARNASKVASFYADDAVLLPPDGPLVKGRTNIETYYQQQFARAGGQVRFLPMESVVSGEHAFEAGTSTASGFVQGRPASTSGKYVTVYRRVAGEWRISYDIFNGDQSPVSR